MLKKKFVIGTFLVGLLVPSAVFGLGISPAKLEIIDILPDNEIVQDITITRSDPASSESMNLKIEGVAAQYLSSPQGSTITLPAGVKNVLIPIRIAPKNAPVGIYKGTITVTGQLSQASRESGENQNITGVQSRVELSVTDKEVSSYTITHLIVSLENDKDEVVVTYSVTNKGNVVAQLKDITLAIYDHYTKQKLQEVVIKGDSLVQMQPFSYINTVVNSKLKLKEGYYGAIATVHDTEGKEIFVSKEQFLQVGTPTMVPVTKINEKLPIQGKVAFIALFGLLFVYSFYLIYRLLKKR